MSAPDPLVIIGANLTGGTAAEVLRAEGHTGRIVLIGSEHSAPYERPTLSKQFLTGAMGDDEILTRPRAFYEENAIETRFGSSVVSLRPDEHKVELDSGDVLGYGTVLLATGSRNRRLPIPGLDLPGVHSLRTKGDAEALRADALPGRHAVILGMGFVGSEVAASLRGIGLRVTVVEMLSAPLVTALGDEISAAIRDLHGENGVEMHFGEGVTALEGTDRVHRVVTSSGRVIECDLVVFGFGSEPRVELALDAGIDVQGGIVVDEFCRTSHDDVFAAGDVASLFHPRIGRHVRVEHWLNARLQARTAALSMLGRGVAHDDVPWFWSDQYDSKIHYAGFHSAWDERVVQGDVAERSFSVSYLSGGTLVGVAALNRPRDVRKAVAVIRAG